MSGKVVPAMAEELVEELAGEADKVPLQARHSRRDSVASEPVETIMDKDASLAETNKEVFPESIYGAAMCFLVQGAATSNRPVRALASLIGMALFVNAFVQIYIIWNVKIYITYPAVISVQQLYEDFQNATYDSNGTVQMAAFKAYAHKDLICQLPFSKPHFSMIILFVWTTALVIEVKQTILFAVWWLQLPRSAEDKWVQFTKSDDDTVVHAASDCLKGCIMVVILAPKLVIAFFLWWVGARWLMATANFEGLLLNCVALAFIVEVDEMVFLALVPHRAKKTMESFAISVPPPRGDSDKKVFKWMAQMGGAFTVLLVLPWLYIFKFQHVLPGYRFDVHGPCESLMMLGYDLLLGDPPEHGSHHAGGGGH